MSQDLSALGSASTAARVTDRESAPLRLVAIMQVPTPYRAFEFDWLARDLAGRVQVHLMFLEGRQTDMKWTNELPKLATWEVLPPVNLGVLRRLPGLRRVAGVVPQLERARPDALLVHGYDSPTLWKAQRWARRNRVAFLYRGDSNGIDERTRNPLWRKTVKSAALGWFFRRVDAFLTVGSANEDYYRLYGAPDAAFFRTGIQVDTEFYRKTAEQERARGMPLRADLGIKQRRVILFVGRFVPEKDLLKLVDAFKTILPDCPDVALVLAGDGVLRSEVEARCADIRANVYLPGFFQPADVARACGMADVFVLPSKQDAWGLVINEALAAGVPVVASNRVGAAPDLVIPGLSGETFPPGDVAALAACLRKVLAEGSAAAYREGARRQIEHWTREYGPVKAYSNALTFALARAKSRR